MFEELVETLNSRRNVPKEHCHGEDQKWLDQFFDEIGDEWDRNPAGERFEDERGDDASDRAKGGGYERYLRQRRLRRLRS